MPMPKHIFFDLDKTLTTSRSPISPEHQELFATLCDQKDVVVVSGGSTEQIREQITSRFDGQYFILGQSGNHALDKDGAELWNEPLTEHQVAAIVRCIEALKRYFAIPVKDDDDLWENRGAQVSYSVIGFHEAVEKKYAFDPTDKKRQAALSALPQEVEALRAAAVEVTPAGTTTYNFIAAGKHKGYNVARLIEREGWQKTESVYVGDALFPSGNDETVIGVIPTLAVKNPDETFSYIQTLIHKVRPSP